MQPPGRPTSVLDTASHASFPFSLSSMTGTTLVGQKNHSRSLHSIKYVQVPPSLYPSTSSLHSSRATRLALDLSRPYVSCHANDESSIEDLFGAFAPERYKSLPERSRPAAKALIAVALNDGLSDAATLESNRRKSSAQLKSENSSLLGQNSDSSPIFDSDSWFDDCAAIILNEPLSFQAEIDELSSLSVDQDAKLLIPFAHLPAETLSPENVLGADLSKTCDLSVRPQASDMDDSDALNNLQRPIQLPGAHVLSPVAYSDIQMQNPSLPMSKRADRSPQQGNRTENLLEYNVSPPTSIPENEGHVDTLPNLEVMKAHDTTNVLKPAQSMIQRNLNEPRQKVKLEVFLVFDDEKGTVSIDWNNMFEPFSSSDPAKNDASQRASTSVEKPNSSKSNTTTGIPYVSMDPKELTECQARENAPRSMLEMLDKENDQNTFQDKPMLNEKRFESSNSPDVIILDDSDDNTTDTKSTGKHASKSGFRPGTNAFIKQEVNGSSGGNTRRQSSRIRRTRSTAVCESPAKEEPRQERVMAKTELLQVETPSKGSDDIPISNRKREAIGHRSDTRRSFRRGIRSIPSEANFRGQKVSRNNSVAGTALARRDRRVSFSVNGAQSGSAQTTPVTDVRRNRSGKRLRPKRGKNIVESSDSDDHYRQEPDEDFEIDSNDGALFIEPPRMSGKEGERDQWVRPLSSDYTELNLASPLPNIISLSSNFPDTIGPTSAEGFQRNTLINVETREAHPNSVPSSNRTRAKSKKFQAPSNLISGKTDVPNRLRSLLEQVAYRDGQECAQNSFDQDIDEVEKAFAVSGTGSPNLSDSDTMEEVLSKSIPIVRGVLRPCLEDGAALHEIHLFDQHEELAKHYKDTRNNPPYSPNVNSFGTHFVTETMLLPSEAWNPRPALRATSQDAALLGESSNGNGLSEGPSTDGKKTLLVEFSKDLNADSEVLRSTKSSLRPSSYQGMPGTSKRAETKLELEEFGNLESGREDSDGSSYYSESSGEAYEDYSAGSKRARTQAKSRTKKARALQQRVCGSLLPTMSATVKQQVFQWADHDFSWFEKEKDFMELKVQQNNIACSRCDLDEPGGVCEETILLKLWKDMSWRKVRRMRHRSRNA